MTATHSNTGQNARARQADDTAELLATGAGILGLTLDETTRDKLLRHCELLRHWNRRLNLTAITDPAAVVVNHLLDSLAVIPRVRGERILDIGSGGGFPGLPLAVTLPRCHVQMLDSRGKRVEFLRHVIATLAVTNADVIKCRVEDYRPVEKFDTLVCRAFASLSDILRLTSSLQHPGTTLLAMKGRSVHEEVEALPVEWRGRVEVAPINVPMLDAERHIAIIRFD